MKFSFIVAAVAALGFSTASPASTVVLDPISDGALYTCNGCNTVSDGGYVLVSGYIQGAVKFSSAEFSGQGPVTSAILALNPYALPLFAATVDIYGYGSTIAALDESDANAGTFLGTLNLPANLGYGEDAYFDVTSFIAQATSPWVGFNLRTTATDVFSSLEYNHGHASQLLVTTAVPIPPALVLLLSGLLAMGRRRARADATVAHWRLRNPRNLLTACLSPIKVFSAIVQAKD